jgi:hypothetical protein
LSKNPLVNRKGIIIDCSVPISGEHHYLYEIKKYFEEIIKMVKADVSNSPFT